MPEMTPPEQITPTRLGDYLDVMSKAVFQSGISWKVVAAKWPGTREVFRDFDPQTLVDLPPDAVDAMATDTRIIRNRRKVEAIITNAQRMLELAADHGSFQDYLRSHADFEALRKDLCKNFKFLGDMGGVYMLYVVGEQVPDHTEYMAARKS
jgi:3-methyladenine DNA glycosylase Tag